MTSRYSSILVLLCAIVAFLPILAAGGLLESYVRDLEQQGIERRAQMLAEHLGNSAVSVREGLERVLDQSPSLCTPTFIANARAELLREPQLKQILVENRDGVQYCDALGQALSYFPLNDPVSLPGTSQHVQAVRLDGVDTPMLRLIEAWGETRRVSAFFVLEGVSQSQMRAAANDGLRISFTNGTPILARGSIAALDTGSLDDLYLTSTAIAGQLPIRVELTAAFARLQAAHSDLTIWATLGTCLMSACVMLLALNFVRRSHVPGFDLERAMARNEIKPYYQPIINLRTGQISGCEVLCRWIKRNGTMVPTDAFIEFAESSGLAVPMTLLLMEQVKADLGPIMGGLDDFKISINLFEGHFRNGAIVEDVEAIFSNSPIEFTQLVFEITERRPLSDSAQAMATISGLHALGARLALDDAGTGHSNLAYIATLGVDVIKIDRVFVDMIKQGVTQVPVLDGLIAMARDLGAGVVAEGVETQEQALYLRARGVSEVQGFFFSPALKATSFRDLVLAAQRPETPAPIELSDAA